jgi:hypothetical protein
MKTFMKGTIRDEKGAGVLALVLVLLVVGGLILTPLLGLMSTGLLAGQAYERHTHRLYAADAGVEDAIWRIKYGVIPPGSWIVSADRPGWQVYDYPGLLTVGDKSVDVVVYRKDWDPTCGENLTYEIVSTAVTNDEGGTAAIGSSTIIDAYLVVSYVDLSNLLNNAIVSDTFIGIKNGVYVTGNVTSGGTVDNKGTVNGTITQYADLDWPTADDLSAWYLENVKNETAYDSDTIDIAGVDTTEGPLYRDGTLTIKNSNSVNATLKLTGTLYITGDTKICYNTPNNNEMVLDLNGQTIFVASNSTGSGKEALQIGDKCTIVGSGCIIAVGDVYLAPKGDVGSPNDFVLIMSVEGTTTLRPSGTSYGCIAGDLSVDVQSGKNAAITHTAPEGKALNIPWGAVDIDKLPPVTGTRIESWEINPQ